MRLPKVRLKDDLAIKLECLASLGGMLKVQPASHLFHFFQRFRFEGILLSRRQ